MGSAVSLCSSLTNFKTDLRLSCKTNLDQSPETNLESFITRKKEMERTVTVLAFYSSVQSFFQLDHCHFLLQHLILGGPLLFILLLRYARTGREKSRDLQQLIDLDIARQTRGITRRQRAYAKIARVAARLINNPRGIQVRNAKMTRLAARLINNTGDNRVRKAKIAQVAATLIKNADDIQSRNPNINSTRPIVRPTDTVSGSENAIASTSQSPSVGRLAINSSNTRNRRSSLRKPADNTRIHPSVTPKKRVRFADRLEPSASRIIPSSINESNSQQNFDELTPLLPVDRPRTFKPAQTLQMAWRAAVFWTVLYTRWAVRRFMKQIRLLGCKIHAWTMRQPHKLPIIGKEMPTNSISLGIVFMLLVNVCQLLIGLPRDQRFFAALAHRAAVLHATNTPFLYLLSMKTQPMLSLFWCSHVHLNIFHRRLGDLMFFFILIHVGIHVMLMVSSLFSEKVPDASMGIYTIYEKELKNNIEGNITFEPLRIITGFFALFGLAILFVNSISSLRSKNHTRFLYIHVSSQLVAQCFAFVHAPFARPYIGAGLTMFVLDRFVFRYCMQIKRLVATAHVLQEGQTIRLTIPPNPPRNTLERWKKSLASYIAAPWAPGCHVFLKVESLPELYKAESRPFYLASARDNTNSYFVNHNVVLVVKPCGLWSRTLIKEAASQDLMTDVVLEGPYGTAWPLEMLRDRDICLLVASPSGIGPIMAIAQSLVDWENGYNPVTDEITPQRQQVVIMLPCHLTQDLAWYEKKFRFLEGCGIRCFIIRSADTSALQFDSLTDTIAWEIESRNTTMDKRIGVICCGPRDLQRAVRQTASDARSTGHKCLVETLNFSDY